MQEPARTLRQNLIHPPFVKQVYTECSPLMQLVTYVAHLFIPKTANVQQKQIQIILDGLLQPKGVTMTLFRSRTVAFTVQVAYWILRVVAPAEHVNHVSIDQRSGDMVVGSRGLVTIHA